MIYKKFNIIFSSIVFITLVILISITNIRCAQIGYPTGGVKDSLPPNVLKANPENKKTNFDLKKINLTFDEYISLENPDENIFINPLLMKAPRYEGKLRSVNIFFKDSLEPNTTYTINFGTSIKDVNEGNILNNYIYTFSTGTIIDSNFLYGKIKMADNSNFDSTGKVYLYKNTNDSAFEKLKPNYVIPVNSKGEFKIEKLPNIPFNVFYIIDKNSSKSYDDSTEVIGFLNKPLIANTTDTVYKLLAYQAYKALPEPTTTNATTSNIKIIFKGNYNIANNGKLSLLDTLKYKLNLNIKSFDKNSIVLTEAEKPTNKLNYTIINDSNTISFIYDFKEEQNYILAIPKNAITNLLDSNLKKNDTLNFSTNNKSEYGSLKLNFTNFDKNTNPILLWFENDNIVKQNSITTNSLLIPIVKPATYKLKILFDTDKNKIYSPGDYKLKKQPEIIIPVSNELKIKANWDNEQDIDVKAEIELNNK